MSTSREDAEGATVAVLGAGFGGVAAALELAARGIEVELYERHERPLEGAGGFNEGKIHLGFVYARDTTLETADAMIGGACEFEPALRRWLGGSWAGPAQSGPIDYCVHVRSQCTVAEIAEHFARVRGLIERRSEAGATYLGGVIRSEEVFRPLEPGEIAHYGAAIQGGFRTCERAVDTLDLADRLRAVLMEAERIRFRPGTTVTAVSLSEGSPVVESRSGGATTRRRHRQVINALWDGRLEIDRTAGVEPHRRWLHRFKYGIRIVGAAGSDELPSTTVVLGPFGDIVRYRSGDLYLSWYPACLAAISPELSPPEMPRRPQAREATRILRETVAGLSEVHPAVARLGLDDAEIEIAGGPIFAWGESDIDDPMSELHARSGRWIESRPGYHSVNTAKYTVAPSLALAVADRVEAELAGRGIRRKAG